MKPLYKYFPLFAALLILAILSTGIYGATVVRTLLYERIISGLEDTAFMMKNLLLEKPPEDLDLFCKTAGTGHSRITVIDENGIVIGDSIANTASMDNHGDRPEIKRAYLGATGSSIRYSDTLKRDMVYVAVPSFDLLNTRIVLRTATPLRPLSGKLQAAYTKIAVAGALILCLISLLGIILTRRVNGALQIISNAVAEYAKGNLAYRPRVYRPAALKEVADTISGLAADLSDRAAEASRQRDALETVFAGMGEAVVVLDSDLHILEMNDSAYRLSDLERGEATGKELLLAFRDTRLYEAAEQVKKNGSVVDEDIVYFSDRQRFLQVHGSLIRTEGNTDDKRIVLVLNDVTRLKQLEQVRKDFVANVSHELKTPITAAKGYVETLLQGDYREAETAKEFLEIVLRHVDRLNAIVEDLLVISRLEQDTGEAAELERYDLAALVDQVVRMHGSQARRKGIRLVVDNPTGEGVTVNRTLLDQGISNLVDNAIKYSESGDSVEITVKAEGDAVRISVSDHGPGIAEEHLDRIFERFYRVDRGRSREIGGTGLGLSIVKHVATSHGGRVSVESVEGEGSTFAIILPRSHDQL